MSDMMSEEDRSYTMSQIRSKGTTPEENLGLLLTEVADGFEVVEHADDLPGTPDYWLPELKLAVFADGCFFHQCPEHFQMPQSNQDYWEPKLKRNVERDKEVDEELREMGAMPIRIWEHDLKGDFTNALEVLESAIKSQHA